MAGTPTVARDEQMLMALDRKRDGALDDIGVARSIYINWCQKGRRRESGDVRTRFQCFPVRSNGIT